MYIIEYADGTTALTNDLRNMQLSHSDRTALERLAPGSAYTIVDAHDHGMTFTRLPDFILARKGCDHRLGVAIQTLLSAYKGPEKPRFSDRPNLRFISVLD